MCLWLNGWRCLDSARWCLRRSNKTVTISLGTIHKSLWVSWACSWIQILRWSIRVVGTVQLLESCALLTLLCVENVPWSLPVAVLCLLTESQCWSICVYKDVLRAIILRAPACTLFLALLHTCPDFFCLWLLWDLFEFLLILFDFALEHKLVRLDLMELLLHFRQVIRVLWFVLIYAV